MINGGQSFLVVFFPFLLRLSTLIFVCTLWVIIVMQSFHNVVVYDFLTTKKQKEANMCSQKSFFESFIESNRCQEYFLLKLFLKFPIKTCSSLKCIVQLFPLLHILTRACINLFLDKKQSNNINILECKSLNGSSNEYIRPLINALMCMPDSAKFITITKPVQRTLC